MNDQLLYELNLPRGRFVVYGQRPDFHLLKVKQTHSSIVLNEDQCMDREADGIIGDKGAPKAVLTADCVPLVLLGEDFHAVIHAGWRGLAQKILNAPAVSAIKPYYAFIGPHIRQENYEVQSDFLDNFPENKDAFSFHSDKIYFSLSRVAHAQLESFYPGIIIFDCGLCTFADKRFHSYRRNKTTERNWNIYLP